jgi:N-glycosylase/DNA lyase
MTPASDWTSLKVPACELRLDTTLFCGQAFTWKETGPNEWSSVLHGRLITLKQTGMLSVDLR